MLGRTNLLFVSGNESTDLSFTPQYILTPASSDIIKLEIINGLFFAFGSDGKVYYGSDVGSLRMLKKDSDFMPAKHIIYADGAYYMTTISGEKGKAVIYKTQDLTSFEEVKLKTGSNTYSYPVHGLFISSSNQIVALIEEKTSNYSDILNRYLLVADTLADYDESNADFINLPNERCIYGTTAIYTTIKKDRIFTRVYGGTSNSTSERMITLDGSEKVCSIYSWYAADYFFEVQNNKLYYSVNGINYSALDFTNVLNYMPQDVFEYDGYIAHTYSCKEDSKTVTKLIVAATPKGLVDAVSDAITIEFEYNLQDNSYVYKEDYVYLGSTGGIIIKAKIESAEAIRPDISLLKTLSARQALAEANEYAERLFAALETRIEALEEAAN